MNMEPFTWPPQWRAFWRNLSPSVWNGTTPITEVEATGELDNIMVQNFVAHFRIETIQKAIALKISISMPFELVRKVGDKVDPHYNSSICAECSSQSAKVLILP